MINLPVLMRRISTVAGATAVLVNGALLISYLFVGYEEHLHSDSAVRLLLAEEIVRSGELMPSSWYFVNGDLWLLSAHWFALPIIALLPVSPLAHAMAGAVSATVLVASVWTLLSALKTCATTRIWLVAIFLGGFSGLTAEGLFGQAPYAMIFASMLVILSAIIRSLDDEEIKPAWMILVAILCALLIATNPLRAIIFCFLPLALALCFVCWTQLSKSASASHCLAGEAHGMPTTACWGIVRAILLGVLLGGIIRAGLTPGLHQTAGVMSDFLQVNTLEQIPSAVAALVKGLLASLGSRPNTTPVLGAEGVYHLLRLALAAAAVVLASQAVVGGLSSGRTGMRFIGFFSASSFALTAFICIGTNLIQLSPDIEAIRYLMPGTVLLLFLIMINFPDWREVPVRAFLTLTFVVGFGASSYSNLFLVDIASKRKIDDQSAYAWQSRALASVLRERGLKYGYATYWLANSTTVHSSGEIQVRPIYLEGGLPVPRLWQSSSYWYSPSAWSGETFIALTSEEADRLEISRFQLSGLTPNQIIRQEGFEIWVFPSNLSIGLGWATQI